MLQASEVFEVEPEPMSIVDQRPLGTILIDLGYLKQPQVDQVLRLQQRRGIRFGEAAHKLGFVKKSAVQQALAVQFGYPCLQPGEGKLSTDLVTAYRPFSPQGEVFRDLRSQLLLRCFNKGNTALSVVSPQPSDGRSFAVANLAVSFAQWGRKTLVIDADLRTPHQHLLFNIDDRVGLSSILRGRAWLEAIKVVPYFGNLSVLPAGPLPPNPLELLGRANFSRLLTEVQDAYEIVLIDTSAALRGADAQIVAAQAGSALLIAREDVSRLDDLHELLDRVASSGTRVIGAALNRY